MDYNGIKTILDIFQSQRKLPNLFFTMIYYKMFTIVTFSSPPVSLANTLGNPRKTFNTVSSDCKALCPQGRNGGRKERGKKYTD